MRVKRKSTTAALRLQDQADGLIKRIFRYLPCVVCLSMGRRGEKIHQTCPGHILNKGMYGHLRNIIWNLLPVCDEHHTKGKAISMHAWGSNTQVIKNFNAWLKNTLPIHYQWYLDNKEDKAPHKLSLGERSQICDDLKYYADNSDKAETLIYET